MGRRVKGFHNKVIDYLEVLSFFKIYRFVINNGGFPEADPIDVMEMLAHLHERKWLYHAFEDGKLVVVIGAYRINEFDEDKPAILPEKEDGKVLYVEVAVSTAKDKMLLRKMLIKYCHDNDVEEMVFHVRGDDKKFKRMPVIKEKNNVKKESEHTSGSEVPDRPEVLAGNK